MQSLWKRSQGNVFLRCLRSSRPRVLQGAGKSFGSTGYNAGDKGRYKAVCASRNRKLSVSEALCIRACPRFSGIFLAFLAITSSLHKILDRYPLLRLMIYLPFILCIFIYWIPAIRRMRRENRHLILLASMITLKEIWLHILLITLAYFPLLFLYILSKKDKYSYPPAVFFTLALLTLLFLVFLILRNRRAARTIRLYT